MFCSGGLLCLFLLLTGSLFAQETAPWLSADSIDSLIFQAQREALLARRAENPQEGYDAAAGFITQAQGIYVVDLQAEYVAYAPKADALIMSAFEQAETAALNGDVSGLAVARGRTATGMLWGSYEITLDRLAADDIASAKAWLRLREYRQSTRVTLVNAQATRALEALEAGDIKTVTAMLEVGDDLRDAYYYRGREALNELNTAIQKDLDTRAAEWAGRASGYFMILGEDYASKMGDDSAAALMNNLDSLELAIVGGEDAQVASLLTDIRSALTGYQPVQLTEVEIAERGATLLMFINLVSTEYVDAVRNGQITNAIEYQEATTFRNQAQTLYEELYAEIASVSPENAERLGELLTEINGIMAVYGSRDQVSQLVKEAHSIVQNDLDVDPDAARATAFPMIDALLDTMMNAARGGRYEEANQARLEAYALFDFGPEPRLMTFAPDLIARVEGLFWGGYGDQMGLARALENEAPIEEVLAIRKQLDGALSDAQVAIGESSSEPAAIMANAAIIVFREGLEAVVILAALIAGMVGANLRYRRPLVVGSLVAIVASVITWQLAQTVLNSLRVYGEQLEAVVSIVAIGVLLLITNWFFHKLYWTQWIAGFHKQKRKLIGREVEIGQFLGLVLLGFTSVYREGFETVLFLQALTLEAGSAPVIQGVLLGGLAVGAVGFLTFRFQRRLPYRKMLVWTGVLIGAVLVTLVGNTIHVMQVVGWIPISPIRGVIFPAWLGVWFGVFATWQGILAQVGAATFVIGSYYLAEYQASKRRTSHPPRQPAEQNAV
jgi:high-affinity iron transporter